MPSDPLAVTLVTLSYLASTLPFLYIVLARDFRRRTLYLLIALSLLLSFAGLLLSSPAAP